MFRFGPNKHWVRTKPKNISSTLQTQYSFRTLYFCEQQIVLFRKIPRHFSLNIIYWVESNIVHRKQKFYIYTILSFTDPPNVPQQYEPQQPNPTYTNYMMFLISKQAQLHNKLRFSRLYFAHSRNQFPHFSTLFSNNQQTNHPTIDQPSNKSYL